jgi:hypothetical protein
MPLFPAPRRDLPFDWPRPSGHVGFARQVPPVL